MVGWNVSGLISTRTSRPLRLDAGSNFEVSPQHQGRWKTNSFMHASMILARTSQTRRALCFPQVGRGEVGVYKVQAYPKVCGRLAETSPKVFPPLNWDHAVPIQNTKPFESRKYAPKYTSEPKIQTEIRKEYENHPFSYFFRISVCIFGSEVYFGAYFRDSKGFVFCTGTA